MERPILCIGPDAELWPDELDQVEAPPERLWLCGEAALLATRPRVAIVGTRSPTPYGLGQAERFAAELAAAGVTVVSGLARGIDSAAHSAALDVSGATIAVLACGVDRPWPSGPVAERVRREGLLTSEFEPGTPPSKPRFPLRNRLISGLSSVVIVIEAAYRSGSLITARWAADQGRDVCALPGRVDQPMARGCHRLLREGAMLVERPSEVLELLGLDAAPPAESGGGARRSPEEAALLEALKGNSPDAPWLAAHTGQSLTAVLARLARLELEGCVARAPGGLYRRLEHRLARSQPT
jgi:DNA processing protein